MKRVLSLILALAALLSMVVIATVSAGAAEETAEEVKAGEKVIYFKLPAGWDSSATINCHYWATDGSKVPTLDDPSVLLETPGWGSKGETCKKVSDGLYSYTFKGKGSRQFPEVSLVDGKTYGVIFYINNGPQTYDTYFTTECYGDTVYCDGSTYENPVDSTITGLGTYFEKSDKHKYGPARVITSTGKVQGVSYKDVSFTDVDIFKDFMTVPGETGKTNYDNALIYSKDYKGDSQGLLDSIIKDLKVTDKDVYKYLPNGYRMSDGTIVDHTNDPTEPAPTDVTPTEAAPTEAVPTEAVPAETTATEPATQGQQQNPTTNSTATSNQKPTTKSAGSSTSGGNSNAVKTGSFGTTVAILIVLLIITGGAAYYFRKKEQ